MAFLVDKQKKGRAKSPAKSGNRVSRAGRKAQARTGSANLAAWRTRQGITPDVREEIEHFRSELLTELGLELPATRYALAEAAVVNYGGLILARTKLERRKHTDFNGLVERVSWLTGNLLRVLKALQLPAKSRPRTLAESFGLKVAQNAEIEGQKGPFSGPKFEKEPRSEDEA